MPIHLIVLVHGVWGTVHHFDYITGQLESRGAVVHDATNPDAVVKLKRIAASMKQPHDSTSNKITTIVYRARCNQGYFTYDGIDICGARLVHELEDELKVLQNDLRIDITHMSIIGYSLGGLISRYAIGLLYRNGVFDHITPVCYTAFCSPHVGVRALGTHWTTRAFNFIGTYAMSSTSRQLFLADDFHNTGKPLLELMTDAGSPFILGLASFKRRVMYANVINDHRCEFYTSAVFPRDLMGPSAMKRTLEGPFLDGYSPVILQLTGSYGGPNTFYFSEDQGNGASKTSVLGQVGQFAMAVLRVTLGFPLWFFAFCCNALYQTIVSFGRQKGFHKSRRAKSTAKQWDFGSLKLEQALEDEVESVIERMYQSISHSADSEETTLLTNNDSTHSMLNSCQKNIIYNLNQLEWNKYPVYIRGAMHTHAAAIVRYKSNLFDEGKVVVNHWLENCLEID